MAITEEGWKETCPHCGVKKHVILSVNIVDIWHDEKEVSVSIEMECSDCGSFLCDIIATETFLNFEEQGYNDGEKV